MRLLVVVDMQEDFIRGALTVPGAEEIISPIEKSVKEYITADDAVLFTRDTHYEHSDTRGFSYAMTREGRNLPILHCVCGTAVLKKRAEIINADAREAAKDQVNLIEKEIRQIKSKIMNLEDLSIKSTESLVVGTDFKADEWVTQMFELRDELRNAEICLEIAQNIYNEYFTELPEVSCEKKAE